MRRLPLESTTIAAMTALPIMRLDQAGQQQQPGDPYTGKDSAKCIKGSVLHCGTSSSHKTSARYGSQRFISSMGLLLSKMFPFSIKIT